MRSGNRAAEVGPGRARKAAAAQDRRDYSAAEGFTTSSSRPARPGTPGSCPTPCASPRSTASRSGRPPLRAAPGVRTANTTASRRVVKRGLGWRTSRSCRRSTSKARASPQPLNRWGAFNRVCRNTSDRAPHLSDLGDMATCGGTDALAMRLILSYDGQNDTPMHGRSSNSSVAPNAAAQLSRRCSLSLSRCWRSAGLSGATR
jgi:hypothetical protein